MIEEPNEKSVKGSEAKREAVSGGSGVRRREWRERERAVKMETRKEGRERETSPSLLVPRREKRGGGGGSSVGSKLSIPLERFSEGDEPVEGQDGRSGGIHIRRDMS